MAIATVLLVHRGFEDGLVWRPVLAELRKAGIAGLPWPIAPEP